MAAAADAPGKRPVALLERPSHRGSAANQIRGREEQLSRIDASPAALAYGQGGVVLVDGAAGMGKTLTVDLLKAAGAVPLTLGRLDEEAVFDIAVDALGGVPDEALARALREVDGHPFWLTELLRGMRDDQLVSLDAGTSRLLTSRIPRVFARSVLRQLDRAPGETRHILELAAVLGERFSFDELAAVSDRPPEDLLGALRQALAADWLVEDGDQLAFAVRQNARRRARRPAAPGDATRPHRPHSNRGGAAEALNERGTLHRVSGELALAEKCHRQSLELSREIDSPWDEAHALAGLGRCALADGHTAQAEALLRQALEIFQRIGAAAETQNLLAELDALAGDR
jgi:hypothetical protein